jgi:hypothetical protein
MINFQNHKIEEKKKDKKKPGSRQAICMVLTWVTNVLFFFNFLMLHHWLALQEGLSIKW